MKLSNSGATYSITPETPDDERILFGFLMLDTVSAAFDDDSLKALDTINADLDVDDCMSFLANEIANDSINIMGGES